jgi:hypothetical protein
MWNKALISAVAAILLFSFASPVMAKKKNGAKAQHIYSQAECEKMKNMKWDDATKTCQKRK